MTKCDDDRRFRCIPNRFPWCKSCISYLTRMKQTQFHRKEIKEHEKKKE